MNKLALFVTLVAIHAVAVADEPTGKAPEEKVFECTGEFTMGKKGPFRELVTVNGKTARIADRLMTESNQTTEDYFDYEATGYQLTLFRKTGRFKYTMAVSGVKVAEGDCKRIERSKVFE